MLSTSHKIKIARGLSAAVRSVRSVLGLPSEVVATRRGLTWSLNLKEGIDLAIYVLGGFELRTLRRYAELVKEGDIVLDIGANIGAHTLPLAQLVGPAGRVISFEPTEYAFSKQLVNISLNAELAPRINAHQLMLMATDGEHLPESVYSSWPLMDDEDLHSQHHGRLKSTNGAGMSSLDSFVQNEKLEKVDFIKLDVDGNENEVLRGGRTAIDRFRPSIMLELAPYVYGENPERFDELLDDLWSFGYQLSDIGTGELLPHSINKVREIIPEGGGINVLACFQKK